MNCEKIQQKFLELDNGARIPLSVHIHMFTCARCRHDIGVLSEQFAALRMDEPFAMDRDQCEQIMKEVFHSSVRYERHVSGLQWGVVGALILASLFLIPFSNSFGWLRHYFGRGLEIPISIVLGIALSVYALMGIFSNMEWLKKFVANLPKKMH